MKKLLLRILALVFVSLIIGSVINAQTGSTPKAQMPESIKQIAPILPGIAPTPDVPYISRPNLTNNEWNTTLTVEVSLKTRNFEELKGRVARGELISSDNPTPGHYQ